MRQVLFQIPLNKPWSLGPLGEVPGFGVGIVLIAWVAMGLWILFQRTSQKDRKFDQDDLWNAAIWLFGAGVIVFGVPALGDYLAKQGTQNFKDGLPIFGYGFMLFVGVACGIFLATHRAAQQGTSPDLIWDLAFFLFLGGIAGGRLFYLIQKAPQIFPFVNNGMDLLNAIFNLSQGGLVLYGALLAGTATFFGYCRVRRLRPLALADLIIPSVFIGIGFGRIGCFLNGCCYGDETNLPWAVQFPRGSATFEALVARNVIPADAPCTPALHPTQIYSALDGFLIAGLTWWYFRNRRRDGEVFSVALAVYPITRFLIEILRNDEGGQLGTGLTISQCISIAIFVTNLGFMVWLSRQPAERKPIEIESPANQVPSQGTTAAA